jgi:hypothetical protein
VIGRVVENPRVGDDTSDMCWIALSVESNVLWSMFKIQIYYEYDLPRFLRDELGKGFTEAFTTLSRLLKRGGGGEYVIRAAKPFLLHIARVKEKRSGYLDLQQPAVWQTW